MTLLACGLSLATGSAGASEAGPVTETEHEVEVTFHRTHATLKVRRSFETGHMNPLEGHVEISTDAPLTATRLATLGSDGRWHEADLMSVHDAVETYWKLTGSKMVVPEGELPRRMPSFQPKDPALMMWGPDALSLFVFPLAEGSPRSVAHTLQVPYEHDAGAEVLRIPVGDADDLPPRITFNRTPSQTRVIAEGTSVQPGTSLVPTSTGHLTVRLEPEHSPQLAVSLASIPADQRHMARVSVTAGSELGPDPSGTHAIVVLDRSRSLGPDSFAAAQLAAQAYLRGLERVPGAKVQVIGFDREVHALQEAFVSPSEAADALRDAAWDQRNGSELDDALRVAEARLRDVPKGAPRRVLLLSDTVLTQAVEADALAQLASFPATLHLADVEASTDSRLERRPKHAWASQVFGTGGGVWAATVDAVDHRTGEVFAPWIRPQRIDDLHVSLDGRELVAFDLGAGEGQLDVELYEHPPETLVATGRVWGRSVKARANRTTSGDRAWATAAAAYLGGDMSPAETLDVAQRAGAVSPHTALLALEPGASPGEAMAPQGQRRRIHRTSCRIGFGSSPDFGRYALTFDEEAFIQDAADVAIARCKATEYRVTTEVTTTYAEVVAVGHVEVEGRPDLAACVRDELWAIEFPPGRHRTLEHPIQRDPD